MSLHYLVKRSIHVLQEALLQVKLFYTAAFNYRSVIHVHVMLPRQLEQSPNQERLLETPCSTCSWNTEGKDNM